MSIVITTDNATYTLPNPDASHEGQTRTLDLSYTIHRMGDGSRKLDYVGDFLASWALKWNHVTEAQMTSMFTAFQAIRGGSFRFTACNPDANMLSNGGFETAGADPNTFASWTDAGTGGTISQAGDPHSGTFCCKIISGTGSDERVVQAITVVPFNRYYLSVYARGSGVYDGYYRIRDVTNAADILAKTASGQTAASYVHLGYTFTAPSGCVSAAVWLYGYPLVDYGVRWDDAAIYDLSNAAEVECLVDPTSWRDTHITDSGGSTRYYNVEFTVLQERAIP